MDRSAKQPKSSGVQKMPFGLFKGHQGAALVRKPHPATFFYFSQTSTLAREGFDAVDIKGHLFAASFKSAAVGIGLRVQLTWFE